MAIHLVKLPDVGEGVAEAEIVEWHVAVGDDVVEDQILAAVMTDKATVEIPSPFKGVVREIGPAVGSMLAVGGRLVTIDAGDDAAPVSTSDAGASEPAVARPELQSSILSRSDAATEVMVASAQAAASPVERDPPMSTGADRVLQRKPGEKPLASPAVRARARSIGVDLRMVHGSGPANRILNEDIDAFLEGETSRSTLPPSIAGYERREGTEEIAIVGLRRKIAARMADASRRIVHFSYIEEVDLTAVEELRSELNACHMEERGKLTILPFILRALVLAVRDFPQMNAHYDDSREIVTRHQAVHVGIATQTDSGLMVPVVAHAEALDLWQSAAEIRRVADAARNRTAKRDELLGSTISITSLGQLGGIATTPIINAPEVAIIGVNRLAIRPVWDGSRFAPRKMMNLSSSFDHRIVDGQEAALFIRRIKKLLEQPPLLFIGLCNDNGQDASAGDRRWPGRLCRRDPGGTTRPESHSGRASESRRNLP